MIARRFSRTGHVLASAGAAIGVANLVIFPYRVHHFGGSAYILAFLAFTLLMGIPLMMLENALGKRSGTDATAALEGPGYPRKWVGVAWFAILIAVMVASFYLVLGGWTLDYLWQYLTDYAALAEREAGPAFGATIGNVPRAILFAGLFILVTTFVCARELFAGIERLSKFAMPLLGGMILFLIVSLPLLNPGAVDYGNLLRFDLRALLVPSPNGELGLLHALGQAFFSLGLGGASMLTFAAHSRRETDVYRIAPTIVHLDTVVAVLGAILVVPLLGGIRGDIYGGPPMVFINLVEVFRTYGAAARFVGLLFFFLLGVAILTSAVSLFEPALRTLTTRYGWTRRSASPLLGVLIFGLAVPVVLSCSPAGPESLRHFAGMGDPDMGYFNFLLEWFGSVFLLVVSLLLTLFLLTTWGLPAFFAELEYGGRVLTQTQRSRLSATFRYVIPVGIGLLLLTKLWTLL